MVLGQQHTMWERGMLRRISLSGQQLKFRLESLIPSNHRSSRDLGVAACRNCWGERGLAGQAALKLDQIVKPCVERQCFQ